MLKVWASPLDIGLLARARTWLKGAMDDAEEASKRPLTVGGRLQALRAALKRLPAVAATWPMEESDALRDHVLVEFSRGQVAILLTLGACKDPKTGKKRRAADGNLVCFLSALHRKGHNFGRYWLKQPAIPHNVEHVTASFLQPYPTNYFNSIETKRENTMYYIERLVREASGAVNQLVIWHQKLRINEASAQSRHREGDIQLCRERIDYFTYQFNKLKGQYETLMKRFTDALEEEEIKDCKRNCGNMHKGQHNLVKGQEYWESLRIPHERVFDVDPRDETTLTEYDQYHRVGSQAPTSLPDPRFFQRDGRPSRERGLSDPLSFGHDEASSPEHFERRAQDTHGEGSERRPGSSADIEASTPSVHTETE